MTTIQCSAIEQPTIKFNCKVLRAAVFNVFYQPEQWEIWTVLAETIDGARKIARYHFYRSDENKIFIEAQHP